MTALPTSSPDMPGAGEGKERPIIFSGPMVRALLEGRKSQTRRILSRLTRFGAITEFGPSDTRGYDWHFRDPSKRWHDLRDAELRSYLPFAPGDRLWVRERAHIDGREINYATDYPGQDLSGLGYRPSIHMPRWASRITLEVTEVRVERLQDISEADAQAEGVAPYFCAASKLDTYPTGHAAIGCDHRAGFWHVWNSIHGKDAWDANPWVAAITFVSHRPEDRLPSETGGGR